MNPLGTTLTQAPNPQYSLAGYLIAIYSAYVPTQLPIAIGEMVVTGLVLQYAYHQRPEVLQELGIIKKKRTALKKSSIKILLIVALGGLCLYSGNIAEAAKEAQGATNTDLDPNSSRKPGTGKVCGNG